jgi:hypothetical protein
VNYITYKTDGTPILVDSNTVDVSTSLSLSGINYNQEYDSSFWSNVVHLLENFSSPYEPYGAISGQLWYDNLTQRLNVFDGAAWVNLSPPTGDLSAYTNTSRDTVTGNVIVKSPTTTKSVTNRKYVESITAKYTFDNGRSPYIVLDNKYAVFQLILSNSDKEVVLPIAMRDTRYSILCTPNSTSDIVNNVYVTFFNKTTTGFKISSSGVFESLACVITGFTL